MGASLACFFHVVLVHGSTTYPKNYHFISKTYVTAPGGPSSNLFRSKWRGGIIWILPSCLSTLYGW